MYFYVITYGYGVMATRFVTYVTIFENEYNTISTQKCASVEGRYTPVKKIGIILLITLLFGVLFAVSAFASEDVGTFTVTVIVNGCEYCNAEIGASVDENVYTFRIGELLDALGLEMTYDDESDTITLSAREDTLADVLFSELEPADNDSEAPSGEPEGAASAASAAAPSGEPSDEPVSDMNMPDGQYAAPETNRALTPAELSDLPKTEVYRYWRHRAA